MTTQRIPALTLRRPWPACFTDLRVRPKRRENRPWTTGYRGPVWLHAGLRWDDGGWLLAVKLGATPDLSANPDDHPVGVVALADLVGVCAASRDADRLACDCGPWAFPGQYHWRFDNVRKLTGAVPCAGRQQLWLPSPETAESALQLVPQLS